MGTFYQSEMMLRKYCVSLFTWKEQALQFDLTSQYVLESIAKDVEPLR